MSGLMLARPSLACLLRGGIERAYRWRTDPIVMDRSPSRTISMSVTDCRNAMKASGSAALNTPLTGYFAHWFSRAAILHHDLLVGGQEDLTCGMGLCRRQVWPLNDLTIGGDGGRSVVA